MDPETLGRKLIGSKDERAVSPVIGVILMVAITVILAAVIAAFVLDIGDAGEPVQANIDVDTGTDNGDFEVTLTVTDATNVDEFRMGDGECDSGFDGVEDLEQVGDSVSSTECEEDQTLIIVGEVDGSEQIVVDTTL